MKITFEESPKRLAWFIFALLCAATLGLLVGGIIMRRICRQERAALQSRNVYTSIPTTSLAQPTINPHAQALPSQLASTAPNRSSHQWRLVRVVPAIDGSFQVNPWRAWQVTITPGHLKRTWVGGEFSSDKPLVFAILTPQNFDRMKAGYPAYTVFQAGPGRTFNLILPVGTLVFVLYRPPQSGSQAMDFPNSTAGLAMLVLKGIVSHEPVHVTATIMLNDWYYSTAAEAESARRQLYQGTGAMWQ